jgi:ribosomal protein S18 acetylase RimI-like enzyme
MMGASREGQSPAPVSRANGPPFLFVDAPGDNVVDPDARRIESTRSSSPPHPLHVHWLGLTSEKGIDLMYIRAATLSDVAAVATCEERAFASVPSVRREFDPGRNLASKINLAMVHVMCDVDQVLGYVSICENADHLFIDAVAVLPSHQGQGLGGQLLAFAEHEALRQSLPTVRLFAMEETQENLAFYHRRGYLETDRWDDDATSLVTLCKAIASASARKMVPGPPGRKPNLQVIEDSNLPADADTIPLAQRRTVVTIEQLSCRWPIGDPQQKDFYFCGARTETENSYCARHRAIAYAPVPKARKPLLLRTS